VDLAARVGFGVMTLVMITGAVFAPPVHVREPVCIAAFLATATSLPDGSSSGARVAVEPPDVFDVLTGSNWTDQTIQQDEKRDGSAIDLYGNVVSDAVAKYKLDETGSLYELHSPQTELPRLGSPKS
jgi:hypothetical protein